MKKKKRKEKIKYKRIEKKQFDKFFNLWDPFKDKDRILQ